MLAFARKKAARWLALSLLALVLIAMVVTGFGTDGMGGLGSMGGGSQRGDTLATVGDERVTDQELRDLITRQFNQARQQQPTLDMAAFLASGAFDQILNSLVVGAAVSEFGAEQGIVASPRMIDREIVNIPAFRNFAGQFDQNTFRQALGRQNITEAQLREDIGRSLIQRQLLGPIALGGRVPETVAREYANLLLERRRGAIGVVPAQALAAGITASDAEVAAFYRSNQQRFAIPERRVILFATIGPDQITAASQATDAEIQAYYRENVAQYGPRETRSLQQVVLQDQAAANAFVARVRGGAAFADAASAAGFAARDITFANQSREQFTQASAEPVAQAAFTAAQGALIGPVRSELGFHVVRVEAIQATPARPIEAVRAEIATAVQTRKAGDALAAIVARVEGQISDGQSIEEIARTERLNLITTPPLTATGQSTGQPFVVPPELQPLLTQAFEIDPENPEPVVEAIQANQRYAVVGIGQVSPAAAPPLDAIRDQVRATLIAQRSSDRARAAAQAIVDRINRGMPAAQAFAAAGVPLPPLQQVNMQRLEISRGGQQVPPPLLALFSLPQGRARIMPAPGGQGWFVIHHVQREAGNAASQPQLIATTRTEFTNSAAEEMAQQFARALELRAGVERNAEAIEAARRRLSGAAAE